MQIHFSSKLKCEEMYTWIIYIFHDVCSYWIKKLENVLCTNPVPVPVPKRCTVQNTAAAYKHVFRTLTPHANEALDTHPQVFFKLLVQILLLKTHFVWWVDFTEPRQSLQPVWEWYFHWKTKTQKCRILSCYSKPVINIITEWRLKDSLIMLGFGTDVPE